MWYYIKDAQRYGPIAETAVLSLFKKGEIGYYSKVYETKQRKWVNFGETSLYKNVTNLRKNQRFEVCKMRTRVFRAVAFSMVALLVYKIFLLWQTYLYHPFGATSIFDVVDMQSLLKYNENILLLQIVSVMQFGVLLGVFLMLAAWTSAAVKGVKSISSRFNVPSNLAVVGCLVPVANILLIPAFLKRIYRALEYSINGRRNIVSLIFLRLLMFIWYSMWMSVAFSAFGLSIRGSSELIDAIYRFRIFSCVIQILLLFGVMIFCTKVLAMLKTKIR